VSINRILASIVLLLILSGLSGAQSAGSATPPPKPGTEYSGMYSFLKEGEFVQVTVEDDGRVTGFVSRYGDLESDKGAFLDHFFKNATLVGSQLSFTTQVVHGVWFQFKGTIGRGPGKSLKDEGYYQIKGSLTEYFEGAAKKEPARSREVEFKSFPPE
jgi:hypothetical protein